MKRKNYTRLCYVNNGPRTLVMYAYDPEEDRHGLFSSYVIEPYFDDDDFLKTRESSTFALFLTINDDKVDEPCFIGELSECIYSALYL